MSSVEKVIVTGFVAAFDFFAAGFFFGAALAGVPFPLPAGVIAGAALFAGAAMFVLVAGPSASAAAGLADSFFFTISPIMVPRPGTFAAPARSRDDRSSGRAVHEFFGASVVPDQRNLRRAGFALPRFLFNVLDMRPFLIRWLVTTASVWVAAPLAGFHYDHASCLVGAALILGIINAFVRPIILFLSLPFIILTLGVGILIVNALLLMVVSHLVPCFHVGSFGHAFFGAILISIVSWILSAFIRSENGRMSVRVITREDGIKQAKGRVIE